MNKTEDEGKTRQGENGVEAKELVRGGANLYERIATDMRSKVKREDIKRTFV